MLAQTVICPTCGAALKLKAPPPAGTTHTTCPRCNGAIALNPTTVAGTERTAALPSPQVAQEGRGGATATGDTTRPVPGEPSTPAGVFPFLSPPEAPDEIGRLGPYRVLDRIGAGGMGVVFRAEDPNLKRLVALKVMLPQYADNALAKARFLREARAQAAVEHDHVAAIFQVGEAGGVPFLAMPLLRGQPLGDALKANPRVPLPEAVRIAREMAEGLAAAHERNLIHRDIKPANVWLEGSRRRVKILDFGLARVADAESPDAMTQQGAVVGTPAYMSPEQAHGKPVDHRSDLFSLGVVLYEMLAGRRPFRAKSTTGLLIAVATESPAGPRVENPDVPPALDTLALRLLAKNPDERPPTAESVAQELRAIEAGLGATGIVAIPLPAPNAPADPWEAIDATDADTVLAPPMDAGEEPPRRRIKWLVAAGLLALVAMVWLAVVVLRVETENGTLVVEINDPNVEARIKNGRLVLVGADGKERYTLTANDRSKPIATGAYTIRVEGADGLSLDASEFTLKKGDQVTVRVRLDPRAAAAKKKDLAKPAESFGWVWPAEDLRAGKIRAPDLSGGRLILEDKLTAESNSGYHRDTAVFQSDYRRGEVAFRGWGGDWSRGGPIPVPPVAFEMSARVEGAADRYWGLTLFTQAEGKVNPGLSVSINGHGEFAIDPCVWTTEPGRGPWRASGKHPAIRPMPEKNRLLVLVRKRVVEVFVNDVAVCDPIGLPFDMPDAIPQWRLGGGGGETVIDAFRIRAADAVAGPAERGAKPRPRPAANNREAAEKVTQWGGRVNVRQDGCERFNVAWVNVPEGPLELTAAHLGGVRVTDDDLAHFKDLTAIETLGLAHTQVTDRGLMHLRGLKSLKGLHLHDTAITDAGLEHLSGLTDLDELILHNTRQITAAGVRHLRGLTALRSLSMSLVNLGDSALDHVECWPELERLYLIGAGISDKGVGRLAGLKKLRVLDLNGNAITGAGVKSLAKIATLETLITDSPGVDDACVGDLAKLHSARDLWLRGTKLSRRGAEELSRALPQCTVHVVEGDFCDGASRGWWRGGDRRFQFVHRGAWVEVSDEKVARWKEVARTAGSVEIEDAAGKARVRLSGDRIESSADGGVTFTKLADGKWTAREEWERR